MLPVWICGNYTTYGSNFDWGYGSSFADRALFMVIKGEILTGQCKACPRAPTGRLRAGYSGTLLVRSRRFLAKHIVDADLDCVHVNVARVQNSKIGRTAETVVQVFELYAPGRSKSILDAATRRPPCAPSGRGRH